MTDACIDVWTCHLSTLRVHRHKWIITTLCLPHSERNNYRDCPNINVQMNTDIGPSSMQLFVHPIILKFYLNKVECNSSTNGWLDIQTCLRPHSKVHRGARDKLRGKIRLIIHKRGHCDLTAVSHNGQPTGGNFSVFTLICERLKWFMFIWKAAGGSHSLMW